MRETIQRVMEAEDEAKRLVEKARQESEAFLAECHRRAREANESTQKDLRPVCEAILKAATEGAHRERKERIRAANAEIEAGITRDETLGAQAVSAIIRHVCGQRQP